MVTRDALITRLRVAMLARRLDRALAAGESPADDAALAARAAVLTGRARRHELAAALELLVSRAGEPPSLARIPLARTAVERNAALVVALAGRLRASAPVYARGVARLTLLLRDGTGPVYCDRRGDALARALVDVADALSGSDHADSTSVDPWWRSQSLWVR